MIEKKRAVVTGGTGGLGLEIAKGLARAGYSVTVVARDPERGARVAQELEGGFVQADLSSVRAARAAGARLSAEGALDLLVNNVGGMRPERWENAEGIEAAFALNHLAPRVLSETLLPALKSAARGRIVHVTSSAIRAAVPEYEEVDLPGEYYGLAVTGRAKLANLAWALQTAPAFSEQGVTSMSVDPGPMATPNTAQMKRHMLPPAMRPMWKVIQEAVRRPASEGAVGVLEACLAPDVEAWTLLGADPSLTRFVDVRVRDESEALTQRVLARL